MLIAIFRLSYYFCGLYEESMHYYYQIESVML